MELSIDSPETWMYVECPAYIYIIYIRKKFNISKYITAAAGDDRPFRTP